MATTESRGDRSLLLLGALLISALCLLIFSWVGGHAPRRQASCLNEVARQGSTQAEDGLNEASYRYIYYDEANSTVTTKTCGNMPGLLQPAPSNRNHKIVDVIPFNHEKDMAYIHFLELYDLVDLFVVTEAPFSHQGGPKPLHFQRWLCKDFGTFAPKIVHVVINSSEAQWLPGDSSGDGGHWRREKLSRDVIGFELRNLLGLHPDDLVYSCDVDELATEAAVQLAANRLWNAPDDSPVVYFDLEMYYYNLHHFVETTWRNMCSMFPVRILDSCTASAIRGASGTHTQQTLPFVDKAGIHASSFLSPEDLATKIRSIAHADFNRNDTNTAAAVKRRIRANQDYAGRDGFVSEHRDPTNDLVIAGYRPATRKALLEFSDRLRVLQELD